MDRLFVIQLITSFIIGGGVISLFSFLAERAKPRVAGLILVFPSTIVLGFFFLGWSLSAMKVAEIAPSTFLPLGITAMFPVLYLYIAGFMARFLKNKTLLIGWSFALSIGIWMVLGALAVSFRSTNLLIGVAGYLVLMTLAHYLLHLNRHEKPVARAYTFVQKIGRAVFIGFIIATAVFLAKTLNPYWGGLFSTFPAAISSALIILNWYYEPKSLFATAQNVPIGSVSTMVYILTAMVAFPLAGFIAGTIIACGASVITTLIINRALLKTNK